MNRTVIVSLITLLALAGAGASGQEPPPEGEAAPLPPPRPVPSPAAPPADVLVPVPGPVADCDDCAWGACPVRTRFWVRSEALLWWLDGQGLPPLVTAGPIDSATNAGAIGAPGTRVLFGDAKVDDGVRGGYRIEMGLWLDQECPLGLGGNFFILGDEDTRFTARGSAGEVLARPFLDVNTGQQEAQLVAVPDVADGTVEVATTSRMLGTELFVRGTLGCGELWLGGRGGSRFRIDGLCGYRYLRLREGVRITENLTATVPFRGVDAGTALSVRDHFDTENDFHGGLFGLIASVHRGRLSVEASASMAIGGNSRTSSNSGQTLTTPAGGQTTSSPAGLLVQQTNGIRVVDGDATVIPEFGLNVIWALTPNLRLTAGYNFLYWDGVFRAGEQIDPVVNLTQVPPGMLDGEARPAVLRREGDAWAQGIRFGLECRY